MNRAVLVGRLTRDPELRYTPNGVAVANFTIACNRPFKNQQGEQEADFINGVVWRTAAENLANYMKKGNQIGVDGRLQSRRYDDKDGKTVFVTEVVAETVQFLETKKDNQNTNNNTNNQSKQQQPNQNKQKEESNDPFKSDGEPIDISDDDLPF